MNNIYVMYIMLCESVTSILLLFKICSNPPINKKRKEGPSPWTGKFFGRHNKAKSSMLFITRQTRSNERRGKNLGQLNKDLSTSNPWTSKYSTSNTRTNKCSIRPTHGRENAYEFKLVKKTCPTHGRGSAE